MSTMIELSIKGPNADIKHFIDDHCNNDIWSIPDSYDIQCDEFEDAYELTFNSIWSYSTQKWLIDIRKKYTSLQFSLFCSNESDVPYFRFIEPNGEEFNIFNKDDLKLACKLLKEYKIKHQQSNPTTINNEINPAIPSLLTSPRLPGFFNSEELQLLCLMMMYIVKKA
jgi:hypothetical protein